MKKMPFFSIIIPAYNAQDYIENCIKSILEQIFQNYEIIIIDDGSTDDTLKIIASYAQACDNIIFSHKENGGIGTAIPIGIELASGQYIVFVDSDDTVKKSMLNDLYNIVVQNEKKVDVIQYGLEFRDLQGNLITQEIPPKYDIEGTAEILADHFEKFVTPSLACRCFAKSLFWEAQYINQNIGIDELLIVELLAKANSLVSISEVYYIVSVRYGSVSREKYSEARVKQYINVYNKLIDFVEKNCVYIIDYIYIKYFKILINILKSVNGDIKKRYNIYSKYVDCYTKLKKSNAYKERKLFKVKAYLLYIYCTIKSKMNNF